MKQGLQQSILLRSAAQLHGSALPAQCLHSFSVLVAAQARQAGARSHLAEVWAIDDVPRLGQGDSSKGMAGMFETLAGMFETFKWIGVTKPAVRLVVFCCPKRLGKASLWARPGDSAGSEAAHTVGPSLGGVRMQAWMVGLWGNS